MAIRASDLPGGAIPMEVHGLGGCKPLMNKKQKYGAQPLFHLKYSHASLFRAIYTKAGGNSFFQF